MESLFGDALSPCGKLEALDENLAQAIVSRTLLPWSVIHNPAAGMVCRFECSLRLCDAKLIANLLTFCSFAIFSSG
jgi:hypothetical protein